MSSTPEGGAVFSCCTFLTSLVSCPCLQSKRDVHGPAQIRVQEPPRAGSLNVQDAFTESFSEREADGGRGGDIWSG